MRRLAKFGRASSGSAFPRDPRIESGDFAGLTENWPKARFGGRLTLLAVIAALPAACAAPRPAPPASPFAGTWTTAEHAQLSFRDDTVVMSPPGEAPTPLGAATCDNNFRFAYGRQSRGALLGVVARQPDLQHRLQGILTRPDYQVAELACGEGGTVYVLLDDRDLLAIHRDRDIGGIERLSRV